MFEIGDVIRFTNLSGHILWGAGTRKVTAVRGDGAVQLGHAIRAEGFGHQIRWTDTSHIVRDPTPNH